MTDFLRIVSALQQQMSATFSRSDVLRPLHIMLGTLVVLAIGLVYAGPTVPPWALVAAFIGLGATFAAELFAYLFCLFTNPDALRSERYHLQKMAIEARLIGDESAGLFEIDDEAPGKTVRSRTLKPVTPAPAKQIPQSKGRSSRKDPGSDG